MAKVVKRETISAADAEYELRRHRDRITNERDLDTRTDVTWRRVKDPTIRCSNQHETKVSGRLMRCSEPATWQKFRVYGTGEEPVPVTYLCDAHSLERGRSS